MGLDSIKGLDVLSGKLGDISTLKTTDKTSATAAANELFDKIGNLKEKTGIYVKDYENLVPNKTVAEADWDWTDAIQAAVNATGYEVIFPANKTLRVDVTKKISVPSNKLINLNWSTLKALPTNLGNHDCFILSNVNNVMIKNGTLIGERNDHKDANGVVWKKWTPNTAYSVGDIVYSWHIGYKCTVAGTSGTTRPTHTSGTATDGTVTWQFYISNVGEWGYGISAYGSKNIVLENLTLKDWWGDGIILEGSNTNNPVCKNVYVNNVVSENNRRQGMSVISVDGLFVTNSQFNSTNGTSPQSGIDFEPYQDWHYITNVNVTDCIFNGNTNYGVLIGITGTVQTQTVDMTINITNCRFIDCDFVVANLIYPCGGEIKLSGCYIKNGRIRRIYTSHKFTKLTIHNTTLVNPCKRTATGNEFERSAVLLYNANDRAVTDVYAPDGSGNIEINGLTIIEESGLENAQNSIYFYDAISANMYNVSLKNIKKFTPNGFYSSNRIVDAKKVVDLEIDNSAFFKGTVTLYERTLDKTCLYSEFDNTGYAGTMTVKLADSYPKFVPVTFTVKAPYTLIIQPTGAATFTPANLRSNTLGNRLTVMKVTDTAWVVTNQYGTWTTV